MITDTASVVDYLDRFSFSLYSYPTPNIALERLPYISYIDLLGILIIMEEIPVTDTISLLSKVHLTNNSGKIQCVFVTVDIKAFTDAINLDELKKLNYDFYYHEAQVLSDNVIIQEIIGGMLLAKEEMYELYDTSDNLYLKAQKAKKPVMFFKGFLDESNNPFRQVYIQESLDRMLASDVKYDNSDIQELRNIILTLSYQKSISDDIDYELVRKFISICCDSKMLTKLEGGVILTKFDSFMSDIFNIQSMWGLIEP
jgi:hypothetical protein